MSKPQYLIAIPPGLSAVAADELRSRLGLKPEQMRLMPARNADLLSSYYNGPAGDLLGLRAAEDVFQIVSKITLSGAASDLLSIARMISHLKLQGKQRVRVVVQASDEPWRSYRRIDMQRALMTGLSRLSGVKVVAEGADSEVWLFQSKKTAVASLRLSDSSMRHREYKKDHLEGSLRPAIAAALVRLSDPQPDDVFLDPMCGSGTILLERAHAGRYQQLLGGDLSVAAVEATIQNFGRKHKPWKVRQWDATNLPLEDASVDVIATNPPWGRKVGGQHANPKLYEGLFKESVRVLKPGGRLVVLTDQVKTIKDLHARYGDTFMLKKQYKAIQVLGHSADIFSWEIKS